jgi:hypothetical protein
MTIDWNIVIAIAVPIVTLFLGALLERLLERRPRIISYFGHVSGVRIMAGEQPQLVFTHSVVFRNIGRKTATNVRLGHNTLPSFSVFPDIEYQVIDLPEGGKEILFPRLIPTKQVTVTYLYLPPLTADQINTFIESDEGPGKVIPVLLTAQLPRWLLTFIWLLIGYGLVALLYTVYEIIRWIV